jgi:Macrocin-O-methyltransferase (TylF)
VLRVEVDTPNAGGPRWCILPILRSATKVEYPHLIKLWECLLEHTPLFGPCARVERCRARRVGQVSPEGLYVHSRTEHNLSRNDSLGSRSDDGGTSPTRPAKLSSKQFWPRVSVMTHSMSTDLYLDLMKQTLTGALREDSEFIVGGNAGGSRKHRAVARGARALAKLDLQLVRLFPYDPAAREKGLDRPGRAESMIGLRRMDNIQYCVEQVLKDQIPGDLIETGVWRGREDAPLAVELRWRPDDHQATFTVSS